MGKFPQQFGKYTLIRKIATGGMAEIFQAKTAGAEGFVRDCVIKRILPHYSEDEAFVRMFVDEASITAKLQHPNIVQIYDFDRLDGAHFIAMEYIEGEDLSAVIKDGHAAGRPLSIAQCVWICMQISKGLFYAHTKEHKGRPLNIIHRDISPHNVMVSYSGEIKLMDFGIAKAAERSTKTQAGTVKGKVAYMSPEQARGRKLDGRSDLFALAICLWEMLTHKRLFLKTSDFETLTAVLKQQPEPASRYNPRVDQELDDILLTALDKSVEFRHKDLQAFDRELTRWYYKHVKDLEREAIKPFMTDLYRDKITALRTGGSSTRPVPRPNSNPRSRATPPVGSRPPRRRPIQEPALPDDGRAIPMTVEEPVPEILKAKAPSRARNIPRPDPASFNSSETLLEDQGPSQAELQQALRIAREQGNSARRLRERPTTKSPPVPPASRVPDVTLHGAQAPQYTPAAVPPTDPNNNNIMLVALAVLFLALGGLIAYLLVE